MFAGEPARTGRFQKKIFVHSQACCRFTAGEPRAQQKANAANIEYTVLASGTMACFPRPGNAQAFFPDGQGYASFSRNWQQACTLPVPTLCIGRVHAANNIGPLHGCARGRFHTGNVAWSLFHFGKVGIHNIVVGVLAALGLGFGSGGFAGVFGLGLFVQLFSQLV